MTTLKIRELKRTARQLLLGNYTILALVTFLLACSNFFLSSVSLLAVPPIGGWIGRVLDFAALLITNMVYTLLLAGMYYITTGSRSRSRSGSLICSSPFGTIRNRSPHFLCSPWSWNMVS